MALRDDEKSLLSDYDRDSLGDLQSELGMRDSAHTTLAPSYRWRLLAALLLLSAVLNVLLTLNLWYPRRSALQNSFLSVPEPWSPANDHVRYLIKSPHDYKKAGESPFIAKPGPELEHAWHGLMEGTTFKVDETELEKANDTSIEYAEGGHVVGLGVFHQLHCLKSLKFWMHKEYFYPNISQAEAGKKSMHLNHCIEVLRQGAMCHPDFTMYTFAWDSPTDVKPRTVIHSNQKCVDWDYLFSFVRSRGPKRFMDLIRFGEQYTAVIPQGLQ